MRDASGTSVLQSDSENLMGCGGADRHVRTAIGVSKPLCPADRVPGQAIGHEKRGDEHVDVDAAVRHCIEYSAATGPERLEVVVRARTPNGIR